MYKEIFVNTDSKEEDIMRTKYCVEKSYLIEVLEATQYSVTRLAKEIGISRKTIQKLLSGKTNKLQHGTFDRLLAFYCRVFYK